LARGKIPYDVAYVSFIQKELKFSNYQYILLPQNFSKELSSRIKSKAQLLREDNYLNALKAYDPGPNGGGR
jgi:hypothetical protein